MRALFRTLIALIYLASFTLAHAGFVIDPFRFAPSTASISFVGCTPDTTNGTTFTFTDHNTGTAGARKTIVGVGAADGATDFSVSSMTVGGASATEVVDSANAGSLTQSAIYIIDNPSGTTATIAVTFSEVVTAAVVCVWAAYDIISETATATANEFQTISDPITLSLNISTGGIAVGMSNKEGASASTTWTGLTERADTVAEVANLYYSGADTTMPGSPLAITTDWTGAADSIGVTASFR
jgi:hypothetical protein